MSTPTPMPKKPSMLVKPTLDTKFHIDYDWWERNTEDLRVYLLSHLLPEQQERLRSAEVDNVVDFVDPETGEVFQLDELQLAIQLAAKSPDYISPQTSLIDSVFRVFLRSNNVPLSPRELAASTDRDAGTILKTIGRMRVYKGLRPIIQE
jgi:hypothetical protein